MQTQSTHVLTYALYLGYTKTHTYTDTLSQHTSLGVDEMIAVAWKHKNVYIDTSAYLPAYYPPRLIHYMNTYGKRKVLFGSNFPQLTWARCMKGVDDMDLEPHIKSLFLYKNAERVFKIGDSATKLTSHL